MALVCSKLVKSFFDPKIHEFHPYIDRNINHKKNSFLLHSFIKHCVIGNIKINQTMKLVLHQFPSQTMSMLAISLFIIQATGFTTEWRQSSTTFQYQTKNARKRTVLEMSKKVGIFFGTSTGNTESAAYEIMEAFGSDCPDPPIEIDSLQGKVAKTFEEYDSLIVGTPTWNTGADTERSGTGWDEIYYGEMQDLNIMDKKVAVCDSAYEYQTLNVCRKWVIQIITYLFSNLFIHHLGFRSWRFCVIR